MEITVRRGAGCFSAPRNETVDTTAPAASESEAVAEIERLARAVVRIGPPRVRAPSVLSLPGYTVKIVDEGREYTASYDGSTTPVAMVDLANGVFGLADQRRLDGGGGRALG